MAFTPDINLWAVLASAAAAFLVGGLWYTVLFGKYWARKEGIPMDQKPSGGRMALLYGLQLVGALLMMYVFAHVLHAFWAAGEERNVPTAMMGAVWTWLGFIVPLALGKATWEGKGWGVFAVNAGYWLVNLLIASAIIAVWD